MYKGRIKHVRPKKKEIPHLKIENMQAQTPTHDNIVKRSRNIVKLQTSNKLDQTRLLLNITILFKL